jgi:hypothetical protein
MTQRLAYWAQFRFSKRFSITAAQSIKQESLKSALSQNQRQGAADDPTIINKIDVKLLSGRPA